MPFSGWDRSAKPQAQQPFEGGSVVPRDCGREILKVDIGMTRAQFVASVAKRFRSENTWLYLPQFMGSLHAFRQDVLLMR